MSVISWYRFDYRWAMNNNEKKKNNIHPWNIFFSRRFRKESWSGVEWAQCFQNFNRTIQFPHFKSTKMPKNVDGVVINQCICDMRASCFWNWININIFVFFLVPIRTIVVGRRRLFGLLFSAVVFAILKSKICNGILFHARTAHQS